jgi:hypothetical protein
VVKVTSPDEKLNGGLRVVCEKVDKIVISANRGDFLAKNDKIVTTQKTL